ncbi:nectin-1-like [Pyxicephalus adspersus]|uniref:nectin-1-like n=1 Tax=Pyxicephalus adspersus TaxID=30357 RepID=UPI003B5B8E04
MTEMIVELIWISILLQMIVYPAGSDVQVDVKIFALLNSDVILKCRAKTTDFITQVTWKRNVDGQNVDFLVYSSRSGLHKQTHFAEQRVEFLGNKQDDGSIKILNATLADEGVYTCIFTIFPSGAQFAETSLEIGVQPAVSWRLKKVIVNPDPIVVAECVADSAKPMAVIEWITGGINYTAQENYTQHHNGTVSTRNMLIMTPTPQLSGQEVSCFIYQPGLPATEKKNSTLKFNLTNIQYAPQDVYVEVQRKTDRSLQLECHSKSNPAAQYTWRRPNGSIMNGNADLKPWILSLSKQDTHNLYICEAENVWGVNTGNIYFYESTDASGRCFSVGILAAFLLLSILCNGITLWYMKISQNRNTPQAVSTEIPKDSHNNSLAEEEEDNPL